jgi:aspartate 1-decarboxylase
MNGAAARKAQIGDLVIIVSFAQMEFEEAKMHKPAIVFPTSQNKLS